VIEILADRLPGGADVAAEIPLSQHAVEVSLRGAQAASNGFADVIALRGLRIAADIDADQPCAGSTEDDLASLSGHLASKKKKAAHVWHTWPLLGVGFTGGLGKGRLTGVQHASGDEVYAERRQGAAYGSG
jgi:hypothetical protein